MAELKEELEFYQIGSSDFSKLTTVTDAIFDGRARRMDSYYDQALATFHDDVQGLTSDEFWECSKPTPALLGQTARSILLR